VVKNEAAYIQEWLAFHLHSGVQHFHLYLNEDEEDTRAALEPFIDVSSSLVCVHTCIMTARHRLVRCDRLFRYMDGID
jgi:hypothetical protein